MLKGEEIEGRGLNSEVPVDFTNKNPQIRNFYVILM